MSARQPGRRRANSATISWVASFAALARKPTRSTRAALPAARRVSRSARSQVASSSGTRSARALPGPVSAIPDLDRVNSRTPSRSSSCLICLVSAGCDTYSRWAARVRPPSSATAAK